MDLALARCSGQELHNTYTITGSPDFDYNAVFSVPDVAPIRSLTLQTGAYDSWRLGLQDSRSLTNFRHAPLYRACVSRATTCCHILTHCLWTGSLCTTITPFATGRWRTRITWPARTWQTLQNIDDQAAQLAIWRAQGRYGLMMVETFPALPGGVRAILDSTQH